MLLLIGIALASIPVSGDNPPADIFLCGQTNGQSFIPSISESFFSPGRVKENEDITTVPIGPQRYVFPVPDESSGHRNCSGDVTVVEYCYRVLDQRRLDISDQNVFSLRPLTHASRSDISPDTLQFTPTSEGFVVKTTPSRNCTGTYCCDQTALRDGQFRFPPSNFGFVVGLSGGAVAVRQLQFSSFSVPRCGSLTCNPTNMGPALLLRFRIGKIIKVCFSDSLGDKKMIPQKKRSKMVGGYDVGDMSRSEKYKFNFIMA